MAPISFKTCQLCKYLTNTYNVLGLYFFTEDKNKSTCGPITVILFNYSVNKSLSMDIHIILNKATNELPLLITTLLTSIGNVCTYFTKQSNRLTPITV